MVRMIDETIRWKINTEHYEHTVTSPPPPLHLYVIFHHIPISDRIEMYSEKHNKKK